MRKQPENRRKRCTVGKREYVWRQNKWSTKFKKFVTSEPPSLKSSSVFVCVLLWGAANPCLAIKNTHEARFEPWPVVSSFSPCLYSRCALLPDLVVSLQLRRNVSMITFVCSLLLLIMCVLCLPYTHPPTILTCLIESQTQEIVFSENVLVSQPLDIPISHDIIHLYFCSSDRCCFSMATGSDLPNFASSCICAAQWQKGLLATHWKSKNEDRPVL